MRLHGAFSPILLIYSSGNTGDPNDFLAKSECHVMLVSHGAIIVLFSFDDTDVRHVEKVCNFCSRHEVPWERERKRNAMK